MIVLGDPERSPMPLATSRLSELVARCHNKQSNSPKAGEMAIIMAVTVADFGVLHDVAYYTVKTRALVATERGAGLVHVVR